MAITNVGDSQSFSYTGGMQSFTAPQKGVYKLEVWGAAGVLPHRQQLVHMVMVVTAADTE